MITCMFKVPGTSSIDSWIDSWTYIGKVRRFCEKNIGKENLEWHFIDTHGQPASNNLPAGITFHRDEDATRFKLEQF